MPLNDPVATVVTQADTSSVENVFVLGHTVKQQPRLTNVDPHRVIELAEESRFRLLRQIGSVPDWMSYHGDAHIPTAG